jgi:glycerophosphoryl diester phosphodiesterase
MREGDRHRAMPLQRRGVLLLERRWTVHAPFPFATLFAHRGLHEPDGPRIENGPSAFHAAIDTGYGIELDTQLSSDEVAVVFHDAILDRLTAEAGPIRERTAEELGRIALGATADRIPTLAATLAQVDGRVPLLVEIQTGCLGPSDGRLESAVAEALRSYSGPVACMSFNPSVVANLHRLRPSLPCGLTTDAFEPQAWPGVPSERLDRLRQIDTDAVAACFVSHDRRQLDAPRIAERREAGVPILAWTVRSPSEAKAALREADGITFEGFRPDLGTIASMCA